MAKKSKQKPVEYYDATLPSGETIPVPRGLMGHKLRDYVEQQLLERTKAAEAEAHRKYEEEQAAAAAADTAIAPELTRQQLQDRIDALETERTRLQRDLDDRDHRLKLRQNIIDELDAAVRMRGIHAEPLEQITAQLQAEQEARKTEQNKRRDRNKALFDRIRAGESIPMEAFDAPLPKEVPDAN